MNLNFYQFLRLSLSGCRSLSFVCFSWLVYKAYVSIIISIISSHASPQAFRQLKEGHFGRLQVPLQNELLYEVVGSWIWRNTLREWLLKIHAGGQGASGMGILVATIREACFWPNEELEIVGKFDKICTGLSRCHEVRRCIYIYIWLSLSLPLSVSIFWLYLYISLPQEFIWYLDISLCASEVPDPCWRPILNWRSLIRAWACRMHEMLLATARPELRKHGNFPDFSLKDAGVMDGVSPSF